MTLELINESVNKYFVESGCSKTFYNEDDMDCPMWCDAIYYGNTLHFTWHCYMDRYSDAMFNVFQTICKHIYETYPDIVYVESPFWESANPKYRLERAVV